MYTNSTELIYHLPSMNQPRGITFREKQQGTGIRFDHKAPLHLLFLLKGHIKITTLHGETCIQENELCMVVHSSQIDCIATQLSRFVVVDFDNADRFMNICCAASCIRKHPIHAELLIWLQYLMATMPVNEKLKHHSIPGVMQVMIRKYHPGILNEPVDAAL